MELKLISKEEVNKEIDSNYDYGFELDSDGLYLVEIVASAKSWRQNLKSLRSFFNDDDLNVKIDGGDILDSASKSKRAAEKTGWNGNELRGLSKTVLIAVNLKKGKHNINFLPDQAPYLKFIRISKIESKNKIIYIPEDNNPAEDGNRRPWLDFILVGLAVKELLILASADKKERDDDDVKLIINGNIEKNKENKLHNNWYWCGKTLKGKEKTFKKVLNLPKGNYFIELWADKRPFLRKIEIGLVFGQEESPKRMPTADNPEWTGDFNDDPDEILLARLIFGEANDQPHEAKAWVAWSVINRMEAKSWWPDTVKGVILHEGQYDPFKPADSNYQKIINPLRLNKKDIKSWYECYNVARDVILRSNPNPTTATHFHGRGITRDWFEKNIVPNGKFLRTIGDTYFYWSPN